jgi:type II secretory pathway pseudopilin PulG
MRKAFTLIEVLVLMIIIAFASITFASLFTTILKDIPRSYRVIQTNTSLLNMLGQLREDVDAAEGLSESLGQRTSDGKLLVITLTDGLVYYRLKNDKVLRQKQSDSEKDREDNTIWTVPNAEIEWRVWQENGNGYAVEVSTHVEHKIRGSVEKKMANSHLYFVGALSGSKPEI